MTAQTQIPLVGVHFLLLTHGKVSSTDVGCTHRNDVHDARDGEQSHDDWVDGVLLVGCEGDKVVDSCGQHVRWCGEEERDCRVVAERRSDRWEVVGNGT